MRWRIKDKDTDFAKSNIGQKLVQRRIVGQCYMWLIREVSGQIMWPTNV